MSVSFAVISLFVAVNLERITVSIVFFLLKDCLSRLLLVLSFFKALS